MKILATFDGSKFSEAILTQLAIMARLPEAELTLLAVVHEPRGRLRQMRGARPEAAIGEVVGASPLVVEIPEPEWAENKGQAIDRRRAQVEDYLQSLAAQLPPETKFSVATRLNANAADEIVQVAREQGADVIVMATHSRGALAHALFGSTTEQVVRSGVAPVLVVHPQKQK